MPKRPVPYNPLLDRSPFQRPNIDHINHHFTNLKNIARKRAPHVLSKLNFLHNTVLDHALGKISDLDALKRIESVVKSENLNPNIIFNARASLNNNPLRQFRPRNNFTNPFVREFPLRQFRPRNNFTNPFVREFPSPQNRLQKPMFEQLKFRKHKRTDHPIKLRLPRVF